MLKRYDNEKAAEEHLKLLLANIEPLGFCPLINGKCHVSCVCYNNPRINVVVTGYGATKKETYYVNEAECTNVLISQELYIIQ